MIIYSTYVQFNEKEDKKMPVRQDITIEKIYKMVVDLQREVTLIKRGLMEEPELRDELIIRMRDIDLEEAVMVKNFSKRYGLK
ncbi:MAG: hypothetical protein U9R23_03040 [Candidatus Cloacimonadota bacterium]|nr:hypothetical protein [Candidatus Cloacimonadota bacterium]